MFKRFFPIWGRAAAQKKEPNSSVVHPADSLLADGLRQLPTPAASADFDQNVLAALAITPARGSQRFAGPRWQLPAAAFASVVLTAVLPQTRGIAWTAASDLLAFAGVQNNSSYPAPEPFPLPPHQAWIMALPPILIQNSAGVYYVRRNTHHEGRYAGSIDEQEATGLMSVVPQWKGQLDFIAAVLRHRLARTDFSSNRTDDRSIFHGVLTMSAHNRDWYASPSPDALLRLADTARAREPENSFFTVMAAALRFEKGQDTDAIRLIKSLPQMHYWNDYSAEEAVARFRWETYKSGKSSRFSYQMFAQNTFPFVVVSHVYLNATRYAAAQEQAGNVEEGIAVRLALLDLGVKTSQQPRQFWEEANLHDLLAMAVTMPSGTATLGHASGVLRTAEIRTGHPARSTQLPEFLRSRGKIAEAQWVTQVLQAQQERQRALSRHWIDFSPPQAELRKLRQVWMILSLLAFSPLVAWCLAGLLTLVWRLSMLRRREEFPAWVAVGTTIGALCEVAVSAFEGVSPFDGLYHLTEMSFILLAPVLTVLIIGVGYLRLRRPPLIALSMIAAAGAVWFTHVLVSEVTPLLFRAAKIGIYNFDEWRHGLLGPLAILGIGLLVGFTLWRGRGATWQVACQRTAQGSMQVGWCLVLAFSLWCASVAWQENVFAEACIQQRLNGAMRP